MKSLRAAMLLAVLVTSASARGGETPDTAGLLLPGETVRWTLGSGGDRKVVAFAGVEGSTLDVRADAAPHSLVEPTITVRAPDGTAVRVGEVDPGTKRHARVAGLVLGSTGVWRIEVATPPARGGTFVVSAKAKVPRRFAWTVAADDAATVVTHAFPAAPGGRADLTVVPPGHSASGLVVDLVSPSGAPLAHREAGPGRTVTLRAALPEIGRYEVRVSGLSGTARATAVVRPARPGRREFRDVESRPAVTGFSPTATVNQQVLPLRLDGVGFTERQTASLLDGTTVLASGLLRPDGDTAAVADIDLADVPPGTYAIRIATEDGSATVPPGSIVLANRAPSVAAVSPGDAPNAGAFPVTITGAGFDATATVALRHASDGATIPVAITKRTGHASIAMTVTPAAHLTGPCDLVIRDPDGGTVTLADAIDLLGFRETPAAVRSYDSAGGGSTFPTGAALDETRGRVLVAARETGVQAVFVLFDAATLQVIDTLVITPADFVGFDREIGQIRVAWDGVGDTFALCIASNRSPAYGYVRVVSAADVHHTVSEAILSAPGTAHVNQAHPAANRGAGGYLVVWDETDPATVSSSIRARAIAASGAISASPVVVARDPDLVQFAPTAAYQSPGRFVVAWSATDLEGHSPTIDATVTDAAGTDLVGGATSVIARAGTWSTAGFPEVAVDPASGAALVAFTYLEFTAYSAACVRLAAEDAEPGPVQTFDMAFSAPQSVTYAAAWNADREEFVVAAVTSSNRVVLRRVNADGTIRAAPVLESYEGLSGVLYGGSLPGTLGLARAFDGVADDFFDPLSAVKQVLAGPIR